MGDEEAEAPMLVPKASTGEKEERREKDKDKDKDSRRRSRSRGKSKDKEKGRERGASKRKRSKSRSRSGSRGKRGRSKEKEKDKDNDNDKDGGDSSSESPPPGPRRKKTGFDQPPPEGAPNAGMPTVPVNQQATRHARRVYVGGLPPSSTEERVGKFFANAMAAIGGNTAGQGDSVVNVYINQEKKFAFVEFRTVEECSNAMALDGIIMEGTQLRVRRPNDYNPAIAAHLGPPQPNPNLNLSAIGLAPQQQQQRQSQQPHYANQQAEGPDRIFIGGLPYHLEESQVRELMESFGPLKALDLIRDRETGHSRGYAFCVYDDPSVTDAACAGLNGLRFGERVLTVRRANQGQKAAQGSQIIQQAAQMAPEARSVLETGDAHPTKVLVLREAVDIEELRDPDEYEDIKADMLDECSKYGNVQSILIPRPVEGENQPPGVGKVYVEYEDVPPAVKAKAALHGRKFGGRSVQVTFIDPEKFAAGQLE